MNCIVSLASLCVSARLCSRRCSQSHSQWRSNPNPNSNSVRWYLYSHARETEYATRIGESHIEARIETFGPRKVSAGSCVFSSTGLALVCLN